METRTIANVANEASAEAVGARFAQTSWVHAAHAVDIDELAATQPDWRLQYDQLSKGRFVGSLQHVRLPGVRLVVESASRAVRQRGQIGPKDVGFAMGLSPSGGSYFHGQRLDRDSIMIGRGDELDLTTSDDYLLIAIVVSDELLSEVWQRLYDQPWSSWLNNKVAVQARQGMSDHVRDVHMRILGSIANDPSLLRDSQITLQLRDAILIEWLEAIPEEVDTTHLRSVGARRKVVDRVCEQVLGQLDQPPTMLKVCRHVGASPRKLDYCFRDVLGISPSKYLRAIRLNGARRELKQLSEPSVTVHDVAARWGFWHMGAFSTDYRLQFGELPSETRRANKLSLPSASATDIR
jgi:AraC family ethanolamine operon transcriptional activator